MQLTNGYDMMRKYNKESQLCSIHNYRWDRLDYLKKLHEVAKREGFIIE
jgi:proline dehydrogenase